MTLTRCLRLVVLVELGGHKATHCQTLEGRTLSRRQNGLDLSGNKGTQRVSERGCQVVLVAINVGAPDNYSATRLITKQGREIE